MTYSKTTDMPMKQGLEPIADDRSRILILGSLPSDASLAAQEYYANPRNHFWRILSRIHDKPIEADYESRLAFLRRYGIGLWDVLKAAERKGSLDSNIRSPVVNDLVGLINRHPQIRTVGLNGTKAREIFNQHWRGHSIFSAGGMQVRCLPSTSPANTRLFEEKVAAWQEFLVLAT